MPRQIESKLTIKTEGDNKASLDLKADWLYGAPAADLQNDGVWRITKGDLAKTYPAWTGWQIGRHDETVAAYDQQRIAAANTDKDGKRHIELTLERPFDTRPQALWAMTTLTAPDGSPHRRRKRNPAAAQRALHRPESRRQQRPNRPHQRQRRTTKQQPQMDPVPRRARLVLVLQRRRLALRKKTTDRQPEKTGSIATDGKTPATLELPLDNGLYVLEVQGDDPASAASIEIARAGTATPATTTRPPSPSPPTTRPTNTATP